MDELGGIVKMVAENGILIVIAVVFIWNTFTTNKNVTKLLSELNANTGVQKGMLENLTRSCDNTNLSLNIIQNTMSMQSTAIEKHDQRVEHMNDDVRKSLMLLEARPCIRDLAKQAAQK